MGTVWWAHDEAEDREVAVKEMHLPPSLGHRERMNLLRRTDREALAAGRLRHPGLIAVYDLVLAYRYNGTRSVTVRLPSAAARLISSGPG